MIYENLSPWWRKQIDNNLDVFLRLTDEQRNQLADQMIAVMENPEAHDETKVIVTLAFVERLDAFAEYFKAPRRGSA